MKPFRALLLALLVAPAAQAATVHAADIVAAPTVTIDFEGGPDLLAAPVWLQGGVLITQVTAGDDGSSIWLASGLGHGQHAWYPSGGDDGWTRITKLDASNFDAVSFFGGAGIIQPPQTLYVELVDNGIVVLSDTLDASFDGSWFGFSGGDFDEIRVRGAQGQVTGLDHCPVAELAPACNVFWFDDLQLGSAAPGRDLPEPGTLLIALLGLALLRAGLPGRRAKAAGVSSAACPSTAWPAIAQ